MRYDPCRVSNDGPHDLSKALFPGSLSYAVMQYGPRVICSTIYIILAGDCNAELPGGNESYHY